MKLTDVLLLGVTALFLIIGIDQTLVLGLDHGYWAFMLALIPFFVYNYRKSRKNREPADPQPKAPKKHRGK